DPLRLLFIDRCEEPPAEHVDRFVVIRGIEQRRFAGRNALRFREPFGDLLVLVRVRVARLPVLADRESVDDRRVRRALDRLEERREERGELLPGTRRLADLAEIDRELVQEDERGASAEELADRVRDRKSVV